MDSGEARVVFLLTDFEGLALRHLVRGHQDRARSGARPSRELERLAFVTDVDWVAKATQMFAFAMPGELEVYDDLDKLEEAKAWAAG